MQRMHFFWLATHFFNFHQTRVTWGVKWGVTARLIAPTPPAPSSASGTAVVHLTHPARCVLELAHLPLITCRITGRRCAPPPPSGIHILCNQRGGSVLSDLWVGISINFTYVTDKQALFSPTFPGKGPSFFKVWGRWKIFSLAILVETRWGFVKIPDSWLDSGSRENLSLSIPLIPLILCGNILKLNKRFKFDHFLFHLRSLNIQIWKHKKTSLVLLCT